jgi:hypothetical protein
MEWAHEMGDAQKKSARWFRVDQTNKENVRGGKSFCISPILNLPHPSYPKKMPIVQMDMRRVEETLGCFR